jgi:hypothetical protein
LTIFVIGWHRQALESENTSTLNEAFCKVCKIDLRAHHADLKKHSTTNKHIQNFQRLNPARKTLDTFVAINVTSEQKERFETGCLYCDPYIYSECGSSN